MAWANAVNANQTGVQTINNGVWTGSTLTQYATLVGGSSSAIGSIGPSSTSGQIFQSGGSSANPAFSTATYPSTVTASELLYASSSNVIGQITTANNGVLVTSNSGVPSFLANSGTAGYVLTANSGASPSWQAAPSMATPFTDKATSFNAVAQNSYLCTAALTATLPTSASQGTTISFITSAASVVIQAATGDSIQAGVEVSSAGGTFTSVSASGDSITLKYDVSSLTWWGYAVQGGWINA